jgi:hypothetical protein
MYSLERIGGGDEVILCMQVTKYVPQLKNKCHQVM